MKQKNKIIRNKKIKIINMKTVCLIKFFVFNTINIININKKRIYYKIKT